MGLTFHKRVSKKLIQVDVEGPFILFQAATVKWLKYCRYSVRKTLFNQSINQPWYLVNVPVLKQGK